VRRPSDQPLGPKSADDYDSDRTTATTKCSKKVLKLQQQQQQQIQQKSSLAATGQRFVGGWLRTLENLQFSTHIDRLFGCVLKFKKT